MLIATVALAATYESTLEIPARHARHPPMNPDAPWGVTRRLYTDRKRDDFDIPSTDPRIRCGATDGVIYFRFTADASNWPTTFPVQASCSFGKVTLDVDVITMPAAADPSLQPMAIVDDTLSWTKIATTQAFHTFPLPDGPYVEGDAVSTLPNVACRARLDTVSQTWTLHLHRTDNVSAKGTCSIPRPDAEPYVLTLELGNLERTPDP